MNRTKYVISLLLIGMMIFSYVGQVQAEDPPPTPTYLHTFSGEIQFAASDITITPNTDIVDVYAVEGDPPTETLLASDLIENFDDGGTIKKVYSVKVPGDDPATIGDEGAVAGQGIIFKIRGYDRIVARSTWQGDGMSTIGFHLHPPFITDTPRPVEVTMSEDGIPTAWSLTLHAADMGVGDVITWSISTAALHGTATASGTGTEKSIGYMPTTDYVGEDSFVVKVTDSQGGEDYIMVNVTITETTYNLVVTNTGENGGSGTVISSPPGIDCGELCSYAFTEGTEVTLTATPAEGSLFMDWSGACSGTSTCILTMTENKAVTATFNASLDLAGTVTVDSVGLANVVMSYGNGLSVNTNASGLYQIKVPFGWSGTVTPSKAGYTFSPVSKPYTNYSMSSFEENYTATLNTYSISGSAGVAGATVSYSGTPNGSVTADSSGLYTISGIPYGWTGTVTPSLAGYTFVPTNREYTNVTANWTSQDYVASMNTFTISGNTEVAGVSLAYTGGTVPMISDTDGDYTITVPYGWTGTVTPTHPGYTFYPLYIEYETGVTESLEGQNYTATINTYTISGNAGIEGVEITYTGGTTTTLAGGNYSFEVDYGWNGKITPSKEGYVFTPEELDYSLTPVTESLTAQDFIATQIVHSITLSSGWNLVSFNVVPLDSDTADILADLNTNYDLVYAWDASGASAASGNWLKYDRLNPVSSSLLTLDQTMGFWIRMTLADTLDVYGSAYPTSTAITLSTAAGGWNLVGFPAKVAATMPTPLSDIATSYSLVYGYRATDATDPWELYDPAAPAYVNDMIEMVPGMGYWIKVTEAATWTVPY